MTSSINDNTVLYRNATTEDAPFIAQVICMALNYDYCNNPLYNVFKELAGMELSQYSYLNTIIAEHDATPIGAIIGYDGARLHELRAPIFSLIQKYIGTPISIEDETTEGEFYLDSIAVLPEWRGCGIGRQLLILMRNRAIENGHNRIGLLVDFDNPSAEKLYKTLGFERINPTTFLGHKMWHLQYLNKSE